LSVWHDPYDRIVTARHEEDPLWGAVVTLLHEAGTVVEERPSRYADKPAVFQDGREIAHLEAPGRIDLRITHGAWSRIRGDYAQDPAVAVDRGRRDWIELNLTSAADLERLRHLIETAASANG
jgi:hypothetical protein